MESSKGLLATAWDETKGVGSSKSRKELPDWNVFGQGEKSFRPFNSAPGSRSAEASVVRHKVPSARRESEVPRSVWLL